jgi:acyl-coenzyme A thioesterase 9
MSLSRRSASSISATCRCASQQVRQYLRPHSHLRGTFTAHSANTARAFSNTALRSTDGVFRELTSARVPTPWIEALRRKEAGLEVNESVVDTPEAKEKRLKGKRMSESYHSVVLPLARDPWLGDTYLNSSGHIRYALPS